MALMGRARDKVVKGTRDGQAGGNRQGMDNSQLSQCHSTWESLQLSAVKLLVFHADAAGQKEQGAWIASSMTREPMLCLPQYDILDVSFHSYEHLCLVRLRDSSAKVGGGSRWRTVAILIISNHIIGVYV